MKDIVRFVVLVLVLMLMVAMGGYTTFGDEPELKPVSNLPTVLLPMTPVLVEPTDTVPIPTPKPQPAAEVITNLPADTWFIIESKTPRTVIDSPAGHVLVKQFDVSTVSRSFLGKFVDGNGQPDEERTYPTHQDYKWIYSIRASKAGTAELLLIPESVTNASDVTRLTITVMGRGPNPPPIPEPDVDPEPDVPTPTPVSTFRVIFVKESGATLNSQQSAIPSAKAIRDYLNTKTTKEGGQAGWREYDPQQIVKNEQPIMMALWETVKPQLLPAPCLVIEVNGHATVKPFPSNVDDALAVLKKAGGE